MFKISEFSKTKTIVLSVTFTADINLFFFRKLYLIQQNNKTPETRHCFMMSEIRGRTLFKENKWWNEQCDVLNCLLLVLKQRWGSTLGHVCSPATLTQNKLHQGASDGVLHSCVSAHVMWSLPARRGARGRLRLPGGRHQTGDPPVGSAGQTSFIIKT